MRLTKIIECCGLIELHGINDASTPQSIIKELCDAYYSEVAKKPNLHGQAGKAGYLMSFSYLHGEPDWAASYAMKDKETADKKTDALKEYIEKNDLGTLTIAPDSVNPSHPTHTIRAMLFTPNVPSIMQFCVKKKWTKNNGW